MRVLLTSFEPFAGQAQNSSTEAARQVAAAPPADVELDWLVLPVVARTCVDQAWAHIEATRPDCVVSLGQAARARRLRVEQLAVNRDEYRIPDNAGNQLRDGLVAADGPPTYTATYPFARILQELPRRAIPTEPSTSAGTFVCNHLFYGLLHRAATADRRLPIGFLHVPPLPDPVRWWRRLLLPPPRPAVMVDGIRHAIAVCAAELRSAALRA